MAHIFTMSLISSKHQPYTYQLNTNQKHHGVSISLSLSLSLPLFSVMSYIPKHRINRLYTKSPPSPPPSPFPSILSPPPPHFPPPPPPPPPLHTIPTSHLHLLPAPPKFPSTTRRCFPNQLLGVSLWRCTVMPLYWWRAARLWKAEDMSRSSRLRFVFSVWRDGGSVGWRGCC